jgi:hypothetical protein
MQIDPEHLEALTRTIGIDVPAEDRANVALRLSMTLTAMEHIEGVLGAEMDKVDPIPPVEIDRAFLYGPDDRRSD